MVRNRTMHCPDLSLDDEYTVDSLHKMTEFLESVLIGIKGKYDTTGCEDAVADIKKAGCCHCCCCLVNFVIVIAMMYLFNFFDEIYISLIFSNLSFFVI